MEGGVAARPERWSELEGALGDRSVPTVIARGLGRSYGDASLSGGSGLILTERLDRLLSFDESTGVLEAEGGASLGKVMGALLPRGWFLPVTPGTRFVTLGGAVAADVHGKNHHVDGGFGGFVEGLEVLLARGGDGWEAAWCSRTEWPELFWATVGGMGLTGVIRRVRVRMRRVETAYMRQWTRRTASLDETLDVFEGEMNRRTYSVAWLDCLKRGASLGRAVVFGGEHASAGEAEVGGAVRRGDGGGLLRLPARRERSVPVDFPGWVLNPWTVRGFNRLYYGGQRDGERVVPLDVFFHPLDAVGGWNRIYGRRGFQQYQFVLPAEGGGGVGVREGLRELIDRLAASRRGSFLVVLKSLGAAGGGVLSFPRAGWTLTLDLPEERGLTAFLQALDERVIELGGRRYLAKDASLTRSAFERMYPGAGGFRAFRREVDPSGRLASSLSRRLGL